MPFQNIGNSPLKTVFCKVCEAMFFVPKNSRKTMCSQRCVETHHRQLCRDWYSRTKSKKAEKNVIVSYRCKVCGTFFKMPKHAFNKSTCSEQCRRIYHNTLMRDLKRQQRFTAKYLGGKMPHYTSLLANLKVIEINGQERVTGAVVLERMLRMEASK